MTAAKRMSISTGRNAWVYTEWDIRRGELPATVTTALASSQWAAFEIDDLEYVQTPDLEYYLMELERGDREVELRITPRRNDSLIALNHEKDNEYDRSYGIVFSSSGIVRL